jgi:hypothetical protein
MKDHYILKLSRYVHLNPVFIRANKSKSPSERVAILRSYTWSSYRGYIGKCKREDFIDYDPILAMMDGPKRILKTQYRRFVESGIVDIDSAVIYAKQRSPLCIGSDDSLERIRSLYHELVDSRRRQEDISFRRMNYSLDSERILSAVCRVLKVDRPELYQRRRGSLLRPIAAKILTEYGGLSQRDVGLLLKIGNGASVSKQIKKISHILASNQEVQETQKDIRKLLKLKERADP